MRAKLAERKREGTVESRLAEEKLVETRKENEWLLQGFKLKKMRIGNNMQSKEQNTENLRDQLEEKRGQIEKLKSDMETKVKKLEGSKARLIATLCKDSEEKWLFMKSDFEQKKKALMEKALSLASIVSQKDQKIDSRISSLKINHSDSLTTANEKTR